MSFGFLFALSRSPGLSLEVAVLDLAAGWLRYAQHKLDADGNSKCDCTPKEATAIMISKLRAQLLKA
jgi:hypothetical protein